MLDELKRIRFQLKCGWNMSPHPNQAAVPLREHMVLSTSDRQEAIEAAANALFPMHVDFRHDATPFQFQLCASRSAQTDVMTVDLKAGCRMDIIAEPTDSKYSIEIPILGVSKLDHIGSEIIMSAGKTAGIVSPDAPTHWSDDGLPYTAIYIQVDKQTLHRAYYSLTGDQSRKAIVFDPTIDLTETAGQSLSAIVRTLVEMCEQGSPVIAQSKTASLYQELLANTLLTCFKHDQFDHLDQPAKRTSNRVVKLAEEYIHANSDDIISSSDIANAAGVSIRSLQRSFVDTNGTSPMRYLKQLRLERARSRLLAAAKGTTVTEIAFASGFSHLGAFSVEYRQKFGETPRETLNRH